MAASAARSTNDAAMYAVLAGTKGDNDWGDAILRRALYSKRTEIEPASHRIRGTPIGSSAIIEPVPPSVSGRCLVTGAAGFIGSHLAERLVALGCEVVGVDYFTDYYDPAVKERNVSALCAGSGFTLIRADQIGRAHV